MISLEQLVTISQMIHLSLWHGQWISYCSLQMPLASNSIFNQHRITFLMSTWLRNSSSHPDKLFPKISQRSDLYVNVRPTTTTHHQIIKNQKLKVSSASKGNSSQESRQIVIAMVITSCLEKPDGVYRKSMSLRCIFISRNFHQTCYNQM